MSDSSAPRRAELFLEALGADTHFRDAVIGDLAEEFAIRVQWDGPRAARRWYYRESLRVAPYLLRDWCRNLSWKQLGYFANVILASSLCAIVVDALVRFVVIRLLLTQGVSLDTLPHSAGFLAGLLLWTLIDGAAAGYVAARMGRRAPLPSVFLVAITWMGVMIWSGWNGVPAWFLATNVTMMMAGTIAGGAIPALRSARTD